jgi:lysozyme
MRQINEAGRTLVKKWEGILDGDPATVNLDPYLDPVGIWTIGWGHAIVDPKTRKFLRGKEQQSRARKLYPGGLTLEQAEALLTADLIDASMDVHALVRVPLNDNQFSALVSFEFNTGALKRSSMLRLLNRGNYIFAAEEFPKWNKGRVDGVLVVLPGLVKRREEERRLFLL